MASCNHLRSFTHSHSFTDKRQQLPIVEPLTKAEGEHRGVVSRQCLATPSLLPSHHWSPMCQPSGVTRAEERLTGGAQHLHSISTRTKEGTAKPRQRGTQTVEKGEDVMQPGLLVPLLLRITFPLLPLPQSSAPSVQHASISISGNLSFSQPG